MGSRLHRARAFLGRREALEGFQARECRGRSQALEAHSGGRVVSGLEGRTPLGSFRGKNLSNKSQEPRVKAGVVSLEGRHEVNAWRSELKPYLSG